MAELLQQDPNNNGQQVTGEKSYSLRPRSSIKKGDEDDEELLTWRRRPKRKQKIKPAPLSKYKRKTANARERSRMREINEAFDSLRRAVTHTGCRESEKLTKISTLRLAMKYIAALSAALSDNESTSSGQDEPCLPPTPPISVCSLTDFNDFDPFSHAHLDLDDLFFS
ncbi:hypothetical protein O3M35_000925 [Rhynocoris fuscipes]|uniref:BHLH domain-containing protein n=1 Tax=Rhynocoris fuscipes TaxID=488301 RepID=A0AAW1DQI3_9HEMI